MVPERLRKEFLETKKPFYCPNGHVQSYSKSSLDILREQLEQKERQLKQKQEALDQERDDNLRLRKNLTRTQNKLK